MTDNTQYTVDDIAQRLGVDRDKAYAFVQACIGFGVCEKSGTKPPPGGKGKGTFLYTFKAEAPNVLWQKIHSL